MSEDFDQGGEATVIALHPVMDLTTAAELKSALLSAIEKGAPIAVDAANVQRITTPCFQVLVAAAGDVQKAGGSMKFLNVPDVFREPAETLGLSGLLGLTEV